MQKKFNNNKKPSFSISTFIGSFETFHDAVIALTKIHPVIAEIFEDDLKDDKEITIKKASDTILDTFKSTQPDLIEGKNIHTSLTLSSNKCSFKTNYGIAFGWDVKYTYDRNYNETTINSVTAKIVLFGKKDNYVYDALNSNGFKDIADIKN